MKDVTIMGLPEDLSAAFEQILEFIFPFFFLLVEFVLDRTLYPVLYLVLIQAELGFKQLSGRDDIDGCPALFIER